MTDIARPTHTEQMAANAQHHELERWRAAQTVRARVSPEDGQEALLECLGLMDLVDPADAQSSLASVR
jgi:hypothetical protein